MNFEPIRYYCYFKKGRGSEGSMKLLISWILIFQIIFANHLYATIGTPESRGDLRIDQSNSEPQNIRPNIKKKSRIEKKKAKKEKERMQARVNESSGNKDFFITNQTGQNIEYHFFDGNLPTEIITEVNTNPDVDFMQVSASGPSESTGISELGAKIEVYSGSKNFPKSWWVQHHSQLQTIWCLVRYAVSAGAFYVGLVSFSGFSMPTIIAGAQLAGLMSLLFMYKNISLNQWLTKNKHWALRLVRYYLMSTFFIGVIKFGIIDAEIFLTQSQFVNSEFLMKEISEIGKAAFVGTLTQGFWGLWNAQFQEAQLLKIDPRLNEDERMYREESVRMKSNFFSFLNSIVNNTLSAIIATGGNMLIIDVITTMIAVSGISAFIKSYPRAMKCSQVL